MHALKASASGRTGTLRESLIPGIQRVLERPMEVGDVAKAYHLKMDTVTRMLGSSPRAVANWKSGKRPSGASAKRLTETERLLENLARVVEPKAIDPWLRTPNPAFEGSTPLQVIERGESDRIWRMMYELASGEPG